ncbi:hypothetical protein JQ611_12730 [Bradyrhizobium sp. AUGA SZCCT0182]|nr:hypothetical protein [Bradyrhizobium sp. AUGA SZCCT0182]MBR1232903.1 hypothetical protein [Bradyrhizobium sp. AUGA SZCCT0182]
MFAEIAALVDGLQRREAPVNIGLEVIDILEPDVKPLRQGARCRAIAVAGNDEARTAQPGFGVAASGASLVSDFEVWTVGRSKNSGVRAIKDVLPQPRQMAKTPPAGGGGAGLVTHRIQKSAVNPLTRLASRIVIRHNYQSPHVEGPAATFDPCPTVLRVKLSGQIGAFLGEGSSGWPNSVRG